MRDKNVIAAELLGFVKKEFLKDETSGEIEEDYPLRSTGVIDSIDLLSLLTHIEQRFGVAFTAEEASSDSFSTIGAMAEIIESKVKK